MKMIHLYFRKYFYSFANYFLIIVFSFISLFSLFSVFSENFKFATVQIESYQKTDFQYGAVLNYSSGLKDEYFFPDVAIAFYKEPNEGKHLIVSSIMEEDGCDYDTASLINKNGVVTGSFRPLSAHEVALAKNVADKYSLGINDLVFAEFPYETGFLELKIIYLFSENYDILHPSKTTDIGLVLLGYDSVLEAKTRLKRIVFSEEPLATYLSDKPQIIDSLFSKKSLTKTLNEELTIPIVSICVAESLLVCLFYFFFFRKNGIDYSCLYLKGASRAKIIGCSAFDNVLSFLSPILLAVSLGPLAFGFLSAYLSIYGLWITIWLPLLAYLLLVFVQSVPYWRRRTIYGSSLA